MDTLAEQILKVLEASAMKERFTAEMEKLLAQANRPRADLDQMRQAILRLGGCS